MDFLATESFFFKWDLLQKPNIKANFKDEVALVDEEVMDPETHSFIHLFIHSLIQKICFEIPFCARQCSNTSEQNGQISLSLWNLLFSKGRQTNKKHSKSTNYMVG